MNVNDILNRMADPGKDLGTKLASTENAQDSTDAEKLASQISEEAQLWARCVVEEFQKIAQEKVALNPPLPVTPTRAPQLVMNPAVQNSVVEDARGADVDKVVAILNSLVRDVTVPGVRTVIDNAPAQEAVSPPAPVGGMQPTQAEIVSAQQDAVAMKSAEIKHAEVVNALYQFYFGGNN